MKERLFPIDEDDRTFGEQMSDLDVPVERPTVAVKWFTGHRARRDLMVDRLNFAKNYITLGDKPSQMLGDRRYEFGIGELKGQKILVLRQNEAVGIKTDRSASGANWATVKLCNGCIRKG